MELISEPGVRLRLSPKLTYQEYRYQVLSITLMSSDRIIAPQDLAALTLPRGIDTTGGVVISGRAPIWLYAYLVHELHPTAWIACYDPRLGAVVVSTHSHLAKIGQVIPIAPPDEVLKDETLCPALMVVGPPDSGKSVLSHALFQALLAADPHVYLQRANWDGEGNYVLELEPETSEEEGEAFKARNRGGLTERFFPYQSQAILNLRRQKSLVIVDVGGKVQPEKQPILEACTHYLIISSDERAIAPWHKFCGDWGNLTPVAVLHSTLDACEIIQQRSPYLEMISGPWIRGQVKTVPESLLEQVQRIYQSAPNPSSI